MAPSFGLEARKYLHGKLTQYSECSVDTGASEKQMTATEATGENIVQLDIGLVFKKTPNQPSTQWTTNILL